MRHYQVCEDLDEVLGKFVAEVRKEGQNEYSQLPPCGHLAITDTPLLRTAAKYPAKVTDV